MDRALNYMSLARKGGMVELGEEPVGAVARMGKARLIVVAEDASDHTWRRAKSFVSGTDQQCIRVPFSKDDMGFVIGRTSLAIAAFTDVALALAFVKALPEPAKYKDTAENLAARNKRMTQRKIEAKAHQRNVRMGRRKGDKKS